MPRPDKGARLYIKRQRGRRPVYVIRDGKKEVSTGCSVDNVAGAKEAFARYFALHKQPDTKERQLNNIHISDVLRLYVRDLPADSPSRETIKYNVLALNRYWGDKSLADVKGSTCREYVSQRTSLRVGLASRGGSVAPATSKGELKTLQAAINHWHRESPLEAVPKVTLPKVESRRERWLTRDEVAALLKACRRLTREGHKAAKGAIQRTDYSHVARFILIGIYTGTRHDAILGLRWGQSERNGHIDIGRSVLFRRGSHERDTSKRRPPVKISPRLLLHLVRWRGQDQEQNIPFVIHHKGQALRKMRKAWKTVREGARMAEDVTPHTLRHTSASWLLWGREGKGARPATKPLTIWETAEVLGADASTVERVYGHHRRPD